MLPKNCPKSLGEKHFDPRSIFDQQKFDPKNSLSQNNVQNMFIKCWSRKNFGQKEFDPKNMLANKKILDKQKLSKIVVP